MKKAGEPALHKFYKRLAHRHIFFGLCIAATHKDFPLAEAILIYRQWTGDNQTTDDALYKTRAQMVVEFQGASLEKKS